MYTGGRGSSGPGDHGLLLIPAGKKNGPGAAETYHAVSQPVAGEGGKVSRLETVSAGPSMAWTH